MLTVITQKVGGSPACNLMLLAHSIYGYVHMLNNSILMWCPMNVLLHPDTQSCTILLKTTIDILTTIAKSQTFQFQACRCLNHSFPNFENIKYIIFMLQEINSYFRTMVVNKHSIILTTFERCLGEGPHTHVCTI